jgi:hypothetical protein
MLDSTLKSTNDSIILTQIRNRKPIAFSLTPKKLVLLRLHILPQVAKYWRDK